MFHALLRHIINTLSQVDTCQVMKGMFLEVIVDYRHVCVLTCQLRGSVFTRGRALDALRVYKVADFKELASFFGPAAVTHHRGTRTSSIYTRTLPSYQVKKYKVNLRSCASEKPTRTREEITERWT